MTPDRLFGNFLAELIKKPAALRFAVRSFASMAVLLGSSSPHTISS